MDLTAIDTYFATRATVRAYTDKEIDRNLLINLIELASHAPTTGNMQLYSVIVSSTRQEREAISPAHFNQPQVTSGAGVVLTFCVDINLLQPTFNKGSTSPLAHHPAEVVEEKSY